MRLDHVAHVTHSPQETHPFYTEVLGLKLVQAYAGKELLLVYALPGGGSLAFNASKSVKPSRGNEADWERQHVGVTVPTREEFDRWCRRLEHHGIAFRLVDDERIYFADPDGLVLEIEVACEVPVDPAATEKLARWRPD